MKGSIGIAMLTVVVGLLTLAACSPSSSAQQPCKDRALTGIVEDSTAAVIPGATIQLDGRSGTPQVSNREGRFSFPCVSPISHRLSASASGFAPWQKRIPFRREGTLHIVLIPADSFSITVTAAPATAVIGGLGGTTLAGSQLDTLADDPDDLQRELQEMGAAGGSQSSKTIISVDGFQSDSLLPPKSSIARIEINVDLFSAENRQAPHEGGQVHIFTKPGAKRFDGSFFATNSSPWMNAVDPFSNTPSAIGKQRYGFTLSGPVRKEGSNFFLALEHRSIDETAIINAITLDSLARPNSTVAAVPTPQRLWTGTARADSQLGARNAAFVAYYADVDDLSNQGVGGISLLSTGYDSQSYDHVVRVSNTTTLTPNFLHDSRVSVDFRGEVDHPNSIAPQVQVAGSFTGGGANIGPQRIRQVRTEWDDDLTYTHGKHSLRAGLQMFYYVEHQTLTTNFNGTYVFGGGTAPVLDENNNATSATTNITGLELYRRTLLNLPGGSPTQYSAVTGSPHVDFNELYPAFFVQDNIQLRPNLTFSTGLRYFYATLPKQNNGLTPRAGVSWAPKGGRSLTFNAHLGLFSGQSANALQETEAELLRQNGVSRTTSLIYSPAYSSPLVAGSAVIDSVRTVAPKYNSDHTLMVQVGLGNDMPFGFTLSANATYIRGWHQVRTLNVNTPLNGLPSGPRPGVPNLNVLQLQSSANEAGDVETVGISNHRLKFVQFSIGAIRTHILSDGDDSAFMSPQRSSTNAGEYSLQTGQSLWQSFASVTVSLPKRVALSTDYYGNGSTPFNITTGFDNNGDGNFNDRPQFARPGQSGVTATPFGMLVSTGGVGVFARNRASLPWSSHVDADIRRTFTLTHNPNASHEQTLTANIRSSNLLNHTNVTAEGGVLGSLLFLVPYASDSGRRIEGGIRYSF